MCVVIQHKGGEVGRRINGATGIVICVWNGTFCAEKGIMHFILKMPPNAVYVYV